MGWNNPDTSLPEEDVSVMCFDGNGYFEAWHTGSAWRDAHGEIKAQAIKAWAYKLDSREQPREAIINATASLLESLLPENSTKQTPSAAASTIVEAILLAAGYWEAIEERNKLESELLTQKVFSRVHSWLEDPNRKPASNAFTASMERQIAYLLETHIIPIIRQKEIQAERYRHGHNRYEKLRRLNPREFAELYKNNLQSAKAFDELVDDLR